MNLVPFDTPRPAAADGQPGLPVRPRGDGKADVAMRLDSWAELHELAAERFLVLGDEARAQRELQLARSYRTAADRRIANEASAVARAGTTSAAADVTPPGPR